MTTIKSFFLQIRALFPIFEKQQGKLPPPPLVTRLTTVKSNSTTQKSERLRGRFTSDNVFNLPITRLNYCQGDLYLYEHQRKLIVGN